MKPLELAIGTALRGAGGGGSSAPRTPIESPDSLRSISYARILDLLSEGEIFGFEDQANPLSCVYLNETPVANADGSLNFKNVQIDSRVGTQIQDYIPGFDGVENEIGVSVELRSDTPWTKTVTNLNLNALRVRLSVPALSKTDTSNGDVTGYSISYRIELQADAGSFVNVFQSAFTGKTSSKYERTTRIDLPAATTGWTIRVVRVTPNANTATIQDTMVVESYAEIIDAKLRMPMSALVSVVVDAEQFNNIPSRAYRIKGRIIKVPSNYDPHTRGYDGVWDGTFKPAWSDNPAWVFYDMALNQRYGLGHLIDQSLVDKWSLYRIAQYCDQLVPNGFGGMEPRFTCNLCLQTQNDALRVMQDMATIFRGIIYATGNTVTAVADMPEDSVYTYNQSNVIDGKFSYSGSSGKVRHTVALVSWNDPADFYRAKVEYVESPEGIARYGIQPTEVIAIGCSSRAQARRFGLYLLTTERLESDICNWGVGLDGTVVAPGKICKVADPLRANARTGGRVSSATINSIVTDAAATTVASNDKLVVNLPSGISEERTILSVVGRTIKVTTNFSEVPAAESVWAVESDELALQTFRILSVAELGKDVKGYSISAVQHVPGKFAFIDNNIKIDPIPIAPIPSNVVPSPTGLAVVARDVVEQNRVNKVANLSWNPVPVASYYRVQWRMSSGSWVTIDKVGTADTDLVGVGAGQFEVQVIAIDVLGRQSSPTFGGPYSIDPVQSPPGYVNDINDQFTSVAVELDAVGAQADQLRADVDAAVAQVQVLQGQVGDILQADTWDVAKTYPSGDLIQYSGKLYRSLIDGNVGNEPTGATDANWEYIGNYASLGEAVSATAANVAVLQNTVTQQGDTITANSQSIAQNAADIGDKADASALNATNATVTQQGNQITAIAADITLLGAHNAGKTAFILDQNKVQIDPATTFAQMLSGLQASDAALGVRVDNEQDARISGDSANATSITAVQASINDVGPNLYPSPSGEEGLAGWQIAGPNGAIAVTDAGTGTRFRITTTTGVTRVVGPVVPIFGGGGAYTAAATFNRPVDPANFRFSIYFYDAEGVFLGTTPYAQIPSSVSWKRFSTTGVPPAGATQCRINMQREDGGVAGNIYFNMVKLEYGSTPTAFTNDASVRGLASVTQSITANVGPGGAYAQATTMLDVNGRITGVSQTNNGTTGDFRILADKFSIESPAGGARTEYSSGNWRVYDGSGTLRVRMGVW